MGKGQREIPGLSPFPIFNTVFIDYSHGDDSTGIVERIDKPFKTKANALAAIAAFYTGASAPSATNRILVWVWPGYSTEGIPLTNFVDWNLNDGIIAVNFGSCIDDYGIAVDSVVYGNSILQANGISGNSGCVQLRNAASVVKVDCNEYQSRDGFPVIITLQGTLTTTCNLFTSTGDGALAIVAEGTSSLTVNVKGSDFNGNSIIVTGTGCIAVYCQDSPKVVVNANKIYAPNNSDGLYYSAVGGTALVNADILAGRFGNVHNGTGSCKINGDIFSQLSCIYGLTGGGFQIATGKLISNEGPTIVGNNNTGHSQLIFSPSIEMLNNAANPIINGPIGSGVLTIYRSKIFSNNTCLTGVQVVGANTTLVDCTVVTQGADPAFTTPLGIDLKIYGTLTDNVAGTGTSIIGVEVTNAAVT